MHIFQKIQLTYSTSTQTNSYTLYVLVKFSHVDIMKSCVWLTLCQQQCSVLCSRYKIGTISGVQHSFCLFQRLKYDNFISFKMVALISFFEFIVFYFHKIASNSIFLQKIYYRQVSFCTSKDHQILQQETNKNATMNSRNDKHSSDGNSFHLLKRFNSMNKDTCFLLWLSYSCLK